MSEQQKYTEEELINYGWKNLESELPKERFAWWWIPIAALFLGGLIWFASENMISNQQGEQQISDQSADLSETKSQSTEDGEIQILNNKEQTSTEQEQIQQIDEREIELQPNTEQDRSIEDNQEINQLNQRDFAFERNRLDQKESSLDKGDFNENTSIEKVNTEIKVKNIKKLNTSDVSNTLITENIQLETKIQHLPLFKKEQEIVNTSTHQSKLGADANTYTENQKKVKQSSQNAFNLFLVGGVISNRFETVGPQLGLEGEIQLNEQSSLSTGIMISDITESIEYFNDNSSVQEFLNNYQGSVNFDYRGYNEFKIFKIDVPVVYDHTLGKFQISGGLDGSWSRFRENNQNSNSLSADFASPSIDTSSNQSGVNRISIKDILASKSLIMIGGRFGVEYKISEQIQLSGHSEFGFQEINAQPDFNYQPVFFRFGAKYLLNPKKD